MMGFTGSDDVAPERDDAEPVTGLVAAVTRDLEKAGRVDTFDGQLALQLARKMAHHDATGIASLSKELRIAMQLALASDDDDPNPPDDGADAVDEVARKRDEKRAAAGDSET